MNQQSDMKSEIWLLFVGLSYCKFNTIQLTYGY